MLARACVLAHTSTVLHTQLARTFHLMQDYIVLCMDVGPSMDIAPPSGGETSLEMAIQVANQIVQQKVGLGVCVCVRVQCASSIQHAKRMCG